MFDVLLSIVDQNKFFKKGLFSSHFLAKFLAF